MLSVNTRPSWWSRLSQWWRTQRRGVGTGVISCEEFQRQITIICLGNVRRSALLSCSARDWVEQDLRHIECRIHLLSDTLDISATGADFFEAFCRVRERLATRDCYAFCYGSSRNVFPSGMCRDMSIGLTAYKLRIGQPARELVDIFDSGPDIELSSVAQQAAFWRDWLEKCK